ncbi:MAG TPA: hypothetical protein VL547_14550 [Dinghuibacter sp.]|uniref:hypothetical protein n=1 Tax=Dinghuibacter sp. TaxID=2024697 RepID=UPI002CB849AD|nr:hypothetical protein [Dinghuibacter sp.]HTJ13252.1 hypothetical protein [Dinghuibacter sp.]
MLPLPAHHRALPDHKKASLSAHATLMPATLVLLLLGLTARGQQSDSLRIINLDYKSKIRLIQGAPCLLPELVLEKEWGQVQNYLDHWRVAAIPNEEFIFAISTLAAIDQRKFSVLSFPGDYAALLDQYAVEAKTVNGPFRYYLKISNRVRYDATPDARALILWIESWARMLEQRAMLSPTEGFLCKVYAGEIVYPRTTLKEAGASYTELYSLQRTIHQSYEDYFTAQRGQGGTTVGFISGWWLPTGNLAGTLGSHPSIGIYVGGRNYRNEYDIVWAFRLPGNSVKPYTFSRNDTSYTSTYYDGGYIGLDYTRYLIHRKRYEFGVVSAIAYDYFSIANGLGSNDEGERHWGSFNEGSFDFNNGVRFKYFLRPKLNIGLAVKYHIINYDNHGGTDMGGNAFTVDLSVGTR